MKEITHELIFGYHYMFYNALKHQLQTYTAVYPTGYENINDFLRGLCMPLYREIQPDKNI